MVSLVDKSVGVKVIFLFMMQEVLAQEAECYSAGSIAGAVVGTLLVTLSLVALCYLVWRIYWRSRRGKHLVLVTDPEGAGDQYAFDNPCFKDGSTLGHIAMEKEPTKLDHKARWSPWNALVGNRTTDKRRALDDSFVGEPEVNVVALRSHDFTGLGFNICGNMRDGIFVKDVLHRGPASESGRIAPGDRIDSIRISFRHMVFEDALTILSYASPYDVQLEVENASNSRPSTLLRTKRTSGSSIAPADRICHPFYRSQSIADLAQIGKASLKRMQQMSGISKLPQQEAQPDESGDYPTLKLPTTSSGNDIKRDNMKLEKTAPTSSVGVVKPERARKVPSKTTSPHVDSEESSFHEDGFAKDTLNKYQKFGVRVLPSPNSENRSSHVGSFDTSGSKQNAGNNPDEQPSKKTAIEAEHKQNEQNSIIEKVGEGATAIVSTGKSHSGQKISAHVTGFKVDVPDTGSKPFHFHERAIDVGPIEQQRNHPKPSFSGQQPDEVKISGESQPESNVKNLLTKGFQNLKDRLHQHDKKKIGSHNYEISSNPEQEQHSTHQQVSTEVEELDITEKNKGQKGDKTQHPERKQEKSIGLSTGTQESEIPTDIPEEVCRAAMAARSNRKSSSNTIIETQVNEGKYVVSQDDPCGVSSSDGEDNATQDGMEIDGLGRVPKRPNKRKAPPPPPEDSDERLLPGQNPYMDTDTDEGNMSTLDNQKFKNVQVKQKKQYGPSTDNENNIQKADEVVAVIPLGKNVTTFADTNKQCNIADVTQHEVTNITIEDTSNILPPTGHTTFSAIQNPSKTFENDERESQDSKSQQHHLDYDIGVNVSNINSDSDSDLERLEADDDSYDGMVKERKAKKGGTTIELNSSHITIHHSPSSDTVQLENESTRKAASLGDLSRLDSEQPMSILERAVSLDLADGGTPHGNKKRKAPLPPPGEEYLGGMPDGDEGIVHRKEPRLETAMDTFQRRRLKKSSDWGTLEEALMHSDSKVPDAQSNKMTMETTHSQNTVTVLEANSTKQLPLNEGHEPSLPGSFTNPHLEISPTDVLNIEDKSYTTTVGCGPSRTDNMQPIESENPQSQQRTVLRITPEPVEPTQVTIATRPANVSAQDGEVINLSDTFTTNVPGLCSIAQSNSSVPTSPQHSSSNSVTGLVSSTPISHSGDIYSVVTTQNDSEILQSPIVTSSHQHSGISSIHVMSSTIQDNSVVSSNVLPSITDPFITAIDSTTSALHRETSDGNDSDITWEQDSQPPELPTTPVPVLSQLSSFKSSPSMTYITEIQVVTTADIPNHDPTVESSFTEEQQTKSSEGASSTERTLTSKSVPNSSSDPIKTEDNKGETPRNITPQPKKNVTVTAIRNSVSRIPMRITTDRAHSTVPSVHVTSNSVNHIAEKEERKVKPVKPPVPPRKSDISTTSQVAVEGAENVSKTLNYIQQLPEGPVASTADTNSGKFVTFSSLTPQVTNENGATRNSTSFEQWVFLDESSAQNGFENSGNSDENTTAPHSMVVSLPSRTQSITHIVLDTKQSSGNNGKP